MFLNQFLSSCPVLRTSKPVRSLEFSPWKWKPRKYSELRKGKIYIMASTDNDEDMNENIIHDNEDGDDDNDYIKLDGVGPVDNRPSTD